MFVHYTQLHAEKEHFLIKKNEGFLRIGENR